MSKRRSPDAAPALVSPLIGNSAEIAAATRARVLEMLGRYPNLVDAETAATLAEREAGWAERGYVHERMQGYRNDQSNKGPGVTLFLTTKQKDELLQNFKKWGYPTLKCDARGKNLWSVCLPEGGYSTGFGGLQFYIKDPSVVKGEVIDGKQPFTLPYDSVVRIESDAGDMWQNVHYAPDGSKKKR